MVDAGEFRALGIDAGDEVGEDAAGKVSGGDAVAGVAAGGSETESRVVGHGRHEVAGPAKGTAPGVGETDVLKSREPGANVVLQHLVGRAVAVVGVFDSRP